MIKQFAHVCLWTNKLQETEDFYCRKLGMQVQFEFYKDTSRFGCYLDAGNGTFIEVFQTDADLTGESQKIKHLCFQVDDIDETIQELKDNGVEVSEKKKGADGSWQSWCQDPNGVAIEFHQYTDQSLQLNGGICRMG